MLYLSLMLGRMSLQDQIEQLSRRIKVLEKENAELRSENERLRKGTDSTNSSMPPSKDLKRSKKKRSLRGKSSRKPGGQQGHKGSYLEMRKEVNQVINHCPSFCTSCDQSLAEVEGEIGMRGQIIDIPRIKFEVTEHRQLIKECSCCGTGNKGELPGTLSYWPVQYGQNIRFLVAYLSAYQYCSVDRIRDMIMVVTGERISTGFIYQSVRRISESLREPYQQILARIKASPVVGSDETGCRISGSRKWFWIWTTEQYRYIVASASRGYKVIEQVLGTGLNSFVLVTDCWAAQLKTKTWLKQICLVHIQRDCKKLMDNYSSTWAKELKRLMEQIIGLSREKKKPDDESQQLNEKLDELLNRKLQSSNSEVIKLRDRLIKHRKHITTCLKYPLVPAHNNLSEQGIRNIKVKQKVSTGFRTMQGATDYGIIRSVIDSARLQGISSFDAMENPSLIFN